MIMISLPQKHQDGYAYRYLSFFSNLFNGKRQNADAAMTAVRISPTGAYVQEKIILTGKTSLSYILPARTP